VGTQFCIGHSLVRRRVSRACTKAGSEPGKERRARRLLWRLLCFRNKVQESWREHQVLAVGAGVPRVLKCHGHSGAAENGVALADRRCESGRVSTNACSTVQTQAAPLTAGPPGITASTASYVTCAICGARAAGRRREGLDAALGWTNFARAAGRRRERTRAARSRARRLAAAPAPAARALAIDARGVAVMTSHALRSFP